MKKLWLVLAAVLVLSACRAAPGAEQETPTVTAASENEAMGEYHKITPEEAYQMMDAGEVTIVDVRTQQEYAGGHIEHAVLVPNESIGDQAPEALPDMDAVLLIYCRSGRRSQEASRKLIDLGYRNVYDFGGINDWPYATVADEGEG